MVRTGGGSSQAAHDDDRVERRRPTASARRQRVGVVIADEPPVEAEAVAVAEEPAVAEEAVVAEEPAVAPQVDPADDGHGFPGGPRDTSILISYVDHVAYELWSGEVLHYYIH